MANEESLLLGQRIRDFRMRVGLKQQDLATQMGLKSGETISQIERGEREVKAWELAKLARILLVDFSDLLTVEEPQRHPTVLWRELPTTQREIKEADFIRRCQEYATLEDLNGIERQCPFPPERVDFQDINFRYAMRVADEIRQRFNLGDRPAVVLEKTLQDRCGVKVWYEELEEGSGAATVGPFGPAILMDSKQAPWRRNYNFAHEVFHLITWNSVPAETVRKDSGEWKRIEKVANVFASCLLLPGDRVTVEFENRVRDGKTTFSDLIEVARIFDVSTEALLYRLLNLRLLAEETVERLLADDDFRVLDRSTMAARWWTPPKFPERFVRLAFLAYQKGRLSKAKLAALLDTSLLDLSGLLQEYGLDDRESYNAEFPAS